MRPVPKWCRHIIHDRCSQVPVISIAGDPKHKFWIEVPGAWDFCPVCGARRPKVGRPK